MSAQGPEEMDYGRFLLALGARIYRLQDEALAGLEQPLTLPQYRILRRVRSGITSTTAHARIARRSLPTMSESIEGLVRRGLLTRRPSTEDRRAKVLGLTPSGEALFEAADERVSKLADDLLATIPPSQREQLVLLRPLYDAAAERLRGS